MLLDYGISLLSALLIATHKLDVEVSRARAVEMIKTLSVNHVICATAGFCKVSVNIIFLQIFEH